MEDQPGDIRTFFFGLLIAAFTVTAAIYAYGIPGSSQNAVCHTQQPRCCWIAVLSPVLIPPPEDTATLSLTPADILYDRVVVFSPTCRASVLVPTRPFGHPPLPRRLTFVGCKAGRLSLGTTFCSGRHHRMGPNGHLNYQFSLLLFSSFPFGHGSAVRSLHSPSTVFSWYHWFFSRQ